MTFLASVLAQVLEFIGLKLINWGVIEIERIIEKLRMQEQAKKDAQALKNAKTDDEKKAALNQVIDDTFKP